MLGLYLVDFHYDEPGLMSDDGHLGGLAFSYQYDYSLDRYFKVDTNYSQGSTRYNGALQGQGGLTPYSSTEQFRLMNLELTTGHPPGPSTWAFSYGLGYRNTYDSKTNQYDYRRDISYYYLILGLRPTMYQQGTTTSILAIEYNALLGGGAMTYLSDVNPAYQDVNFTFQGGSAYKLGVENYLTVFNDIKMFLDFSYKYWSLPDSVTKYIGNGKYGVEPKNHTGLFSITIGYIF